MQSDNERGVFGIIEALLAVVGAITVVGILAVAGSVLAWEMELRRSEQEEGSLVEPPTAPTA